MDVTRLSGKVVVVTGAGTGIGAAVCRRAVAEGARVVLTGRRAEPLEKVASELGEEVALVVPADSASPEDAARVVSATLNRFGRLDVLVANAGAHYPGAVLELGDDDWHAAVRANLDTAFVMARAALPALIAARGTVVVISSIAGLFAGPEAAGYVTTKHALIGLTRSLARDYGSQGVRVNAVCPGWVRTEMADVQMDELGRRSGVDREAAYALVTKDTPLRRAADSDEIAAVTAFLASPESSAMTGAVVVADCGAGCVDLPTLAFVPDAD